jgi:hypothetical protein
MFGGAALVWVLVISGSPAVPVGYFKTKEACIDGARNATVVFVDKTAPFQGGGYCFPVENPMVK